MIPEIGVPFEPGISFLDLRERAAAACRTAEDLENMGLDLTLSDDDNEVAATLAAAYATDPEKTSKTVSTKNMNSMTPASLVLTSNILSEFGRLVVQDSIQLRHMVTNKLILESENPDARIRLRALELLGKISDVGLFTEKKEITHHHTSTEELRATLKDKLGRLINPDDTVEDAVYEVMDDTGG